MTSKDDRKRTSKSREKLSDSGLTEHKTVSTASSLHNSSSSSVRLVPSKHTFKVGSQIAIHEDEESVKDFFSRFGLLWDVNYATYLGTNALIKSVGADGGVVLEMQ